MADAPWVEPEDIMSSILLRDNPNEHTVDRYGSSLMADCIANELSDIERAFNDECPALHLRGYCNHSADLDVFLDHILCSSKSNSPSLKRAILHDRVLITGNPGSGKTTFTRRANRFRLASSRLPIAFDMDLNLGFRGPDNGCYSPWLVRPEAVVDRMRAAQNLMFACGTCENIYNRQSIPYTDESGTARIYEMEPIAELPWHKVIHLTYQPTVDEMAFRFSEQRAKTHSISQETQRVIARNLKNQLIPDYVTVLDVTGIRYERDLVKLVLDEVFA